MLKVAGVSRQILETSAVRAGRGEELSMGKYNQ